MEIIIILLHTIIIKYIIIILINNNLEEHACTNHATEHNAHSTRMHEAITWNFSDPIWA